MRYYDCPDLDGKQTWLTERPPELQSPVSQLVLSTHLRYPLGLACPERMWPINIGEEETRRLPECVTHVGDKWLVKDIHDSSKPVIGTNVISRVSYQHATEVQRGWEHVMGGCIHSGIRGSQEGSRNYLEADCRKRALIPAKEIPSLACPHPGWVLGSSTQMSESPCGILGTRDWIQKRGGLSHFTLGAAVPSPLSG